MSKKSYITTNDDKPVYEIGNEKDEMFIALKLKRVDKVEEPWEYPSEWIEEAYNLKGGDLYGANVYIASLSEINDIALEYDLKKL